MPRKNLVSLFSNIGVSEAYLEEIGVKTISANEIDPERCEVYKKIYSGDMICGDITLDVTKNQIIAGCAGKKIDFLIATPPCQGFSTLNAKKKDDPRNHLVTHALDVAKRLDVDYVLIENVPRMLNHQIAGQPVIDFIKSEMSGYRCQHHILDAADFDTPQTRRRVFILLSKQSVKYWEIPFKGKRVTLRDAIGYLPSLESEQHLTNDQLLVLPVLPSYLIRASKEFKEYIKTWHYAQKHGVNHIDWMSNTPEGKSAFENKEHFPQVNGRRIKGYGNTYKRMEWDKPANTLIAGSTMISSSNTVHPGRKNLDGTYSDARTFSILEAMLIMGLPFGWKLPEGIAYRKAIHYIGEGLCPKVLKALLSPLV